MAVTRPPFALELPLAHAHHLTRPPPSLPLTPALLVRPRPLCSAVGFDSDMLAPSSPGHLPVERYRSRSFPAVGRHWSKVGRQCSSLEFTPCTQGASDRPPGSRRERSDFDPFLLSVLGGSAISSSDPSVLEPLEADKYIFLASCLPPASPTALFSLTRTPGRETRRANRHPHRRLHHPRPPKWRKPSKPKTVQV
ncbi:hypothetical protein FRC08_000688 [Ceratobasidium sp. 394]|nr:hypothetical protein FRC08_000688 [Ceratobasidium sp. 394]